MQYFRQMGVIARVKKEVRALPSLRPTHKGTRPLDPVICNCLYGKSMHVDKLLIQRDS